MRYTLERFLNVYDADYIYLLFAEQQPVYINCKKEGSAKMVRAFLNMRFEFVSYENNMKALTLSI